MHGGPRPAARYVRPAETEAISPLGTTVAVGYDSYGLTVTTATIPLLSRW
jgi:hypothetical protein